MLNSTNENELRFNRDVGAAAYLTSYIRLMAKELGIDVSEQDNVNAMALGLVEPLNLGVEAGFRAMMCDHKGVNHTLQSLRLHLKKMMNETSKMKERNNGQSQ